MLIDKNRRARVVALQVLFSNDLNPGQQMPEDMISERVKKDEEQIRYAHRLIEGVTLRKKELDSLIESVLVNWRFSRLAETDKNVLRIGVYELMNVKEPVAILMNEAIEIAKEYGDKKSGGFVNGVLDKVRKILEETNQLAALPVSESGDMGN
ncbi:MAG: transcription antitermination factor NusB [Planctomycetaceae bacterium]|nr:transcription antitermination factor NusB [Planctomycetaceae bacterium]MBQ2821879.1 transcription antitermination factor NusB [Thermoguttaceae bacterium]MDO4424555.1 transcription antitermination factor NusB [Planctomycetia bacterium]